MLVVGLCAAPTPANRFTPEDRAWWAFQPVREPAVPATGNAWARNAVDQFIAQQMEAQQLRPAAEADRRTLIRRATFDLTGLPPTPEAIADFLSDNSADAYEKLVDRLLASPAYGERQARLWLDLVRYAESDGYKQDDPRPEAWRYRDYVIASFNTDKPYDRFVREQLAGDELDPGNRDALTGTMFLRHGLYEYNQRDVETQWDEILNDITDVTADVFLAMGVQCARCHNHKFDPILRQDYFRLRAFFAPLLPREDQPVASVAVREQHFAAQQRWEKASETIRKRLHEIETPALLAHTTKEGFDKFIPEIQAMIRKRPQDRAPYERQIAELASLQFGTEPAKLAQWLSAGQKLEWEKLRAALAALDALKPAPLPTAAFVISDVGAHAPPTRIPGRDAVIEPGFLTILDSDNAAITPPSAALQSTGRRSALAQWITRAESPFAARVMVNRIWQQHFGRGLAANTSDFGRLGEKPSHPELLDWLATRFVRSGWSMKAMHRLMVTSATYRQSAVHPAAEEKDPTNLWLARAVIRRLDAEQVRDTLLAASGELDRRAGGEAEAPARSLRRSIYNQMMRNRPDDLLETFDAPDLITHTPQRNLTTTATQSLLMLNSDWVLARAQAMARRLRPSDSQSDARSNAQIAQQAYQLVYGRAPTAVQLERAVEFLGATSPAIAEAGTKLKPDTGPITAPLDGVAGTVAAVLTPNTRQRSLQVDELQGAPTGNFTVEARFMLRSLYPDAAVRTIISQWDGNKAHAGWALGITSQKSAYQPRHLILQLTGISAKGDNGYEVIASKLYTSDNESYAVAVSVSFGKGGDGVATFHLQNLSRAHSPLQTARVPFNRNQNYAGRQPLVIGGYAGAERHLWDGLVDDVRLSAVALEPGQFWAAQAGPDTVGFWRFENGAFARDSSTRGNHLRVNAAPAVADPRWANLVDLCHVLLNTNEFIYVD